MRAARSRTSCSTSSRTRRRSPSRTLAGAAVGGAVDALVGGASLLAGTAIGGAVGGATALFGLGRRYASVRQIGPGGIAGWWSAARRYWEGGRRFRIGPHAQPN